MIVVVNHTGTSVYTRAATSLTAQGMKIVQDTHDITMHSGCRLDYVQLAYISVFGALCEVK
jgi:hypothetical protein